MWFYVWRTNDCKLTMIEVFVHFAFFAIIPIMFLSHDFLTDWCATLQSIPVLFFLLSINISVRIFSPRESLSLVCYQRCRTFFKCGLVIYTGLIVGRCWLLFSPFFFCTYSWNVLLRKCNYHCADWIHERINDVEQTTRISFNLPSIFCDNVSKSNAHIEVVTLFFISSVVVIVPWTPNCVGEFFPSFCLISVVNFYFSIRKSYESLSDH